MINILHCRTTKRGQPEKDTSKLPLLQIGECRKQIMHQTPQEKPDLIRGTDDNFRNLSTIDTSRRTLTLSHSFLL